MGTGRKFHKTHHTRPRKGDAGRRRRTIVQRRRLVGLGMDEAVVAKLEQEEVRALLRRPAKVAAQYAVAVTA